MSQSINPALQPFIKQWGLAAAPVMLFTIGMPFVLILLPSLTTLLLSLIGLIAGIFFFFYRLVRIPAGTSQSRALVTRLLAAIVFILIFAAIFTQIQDRLLFGYKAVDNALSPILINGDHYFGDRLLFRYMPLKVGDIYVVKDKKNKVYAARLLGQAGNSRGLDEVTGEEQSNNYAFHSGRSPPATVMVQQEDILAKAVVIYWCFDPLNQTPIWERSGQIIRQAETADDTH